MGEIVQLAQRRPAVSMDTMGDFNDSLSYILRQSNSLPKDGDGKRIRRYANLQAWFLKIISREIIQQRMLSEDVFMCGLYIASVFGGAGCDLEKYAVDFLQQWSESSDPKFLQKGGDFCFILCGGFPKRGNRRAIKLDYYQKMGAGFYRHFYAATGKPIGHFMSINFELMQRITNSALANSTQ